MKSLESNTLVALCSLALALFTTASGALLWYVNTEKKKYAAERDFNHLKRNQEMISQGIAHGFDELEKRFDTLSRDILEIKSWMIQRKVDQQRERD